MGLKEMGVEAFRRQVLFGCFFVVVSILGLGQTMVCARDMSNLNSSNVLRYALHTSKIGSLDPHFAKGSQDRTYADMVFSSLVRYTPGDARNLEPDLATKIPQFIIRNGKQIWTIHLRPGVMFHESPYLPAHELTAQDVVFSLEKAGNRETSLFSGGYQGMDFEIEDPHTLRIILETPISPLFFLPRIANWKGGFILSKQAAKVKGYKKFLSHPVGTGPFQFQQYIPGDKLVLKSNDRYFRGKPRLEGIEIYFMPDNRAREAAYTAGQLDVIYGIGTPGWLAKMESQPNTRVDVFGPGYTGLFHFNTSLKPLDDIRVRQAFACVMDRAAFMAATSARLVTPVLSPMSSVFLPGGLDNTKVETLDLKFEINLDEARKLLTEAGVGDGFDLNLVVSEKRLYQKTYGVLKDQLKPLGIQVNITTVSHSQYHKMIRQNLNPIVLYFTFRPNADAYMRGFFHSDSIVKVGKNPNTNFSHYRGIDRLLDHALTTTDPRRQVMLWEQAQIKLLSDVMVFPLFDANQCSVRRTHVDYGHPLQSSLADYPLFNEKTRLIIP